GRSRLMHHDVLLFWRGDVSDRLWSRGRTGDGECRRSTTAQRVLLTCVVLAITVAVALAAAATQRSLNHVRVFARVGFPGQPEAIAVGPDGLVYVGTNQENRGIGSRARSRIFVYDRHGRVVRVEVIRGQHLSQSHGVIGLIFDGSGLLYVLDRSTPARVIRLDPTTGKQQTFATFSDVPLCGPRPAVPAPT